MIIKKMQNIIFEKVAYTNQEAENLTHCVSKFMGEPLELKEAEKSEDEDTVLYTYN